MRPSHHSDSRKIRLVIGLLRRWRLALVLLWVCMCAWLVRFEAFPHLFSNTADGYSSFYRADLLSSETWFRVLLDDKVIGWAFTSFLQNDDNPVELYELNMTLHAQLPQTSPPTPIQGRITVMLDPLQQPVSFRAGINARNQKAYVSGKRLEGDLFEISLSVGGLQTRRTTRIPLDAVLRNPASAMAVQDLAPGKTLRVKSVSILSMTPQETLMRGIRYEQVKLSTGKSIRALLVETTYEGNKLNSWFDDQGNMVRQELPFGMVIESCTEAEADAIATGNTPEPGESK